MAELPLYRVVVVDNNGDWTEMHRFESLSFGYSLNRSSIAELTLSLTSEDVSSKLNELNTATLSSWLRIYRWSDRNDKRTERLVWYGRLFDPTYNITEDSGSVVLRYKDLAGILAHRRVSKDYTVSTATDASQILWNLINDSQSITYAGTVVGDLGIVQGAAPVSKNRQPEKDLRNRTILDVMTSFSEYEDGIDWEITPTPRNQNIGLFNTYYRGSGQLYHKGHQNETKLIFHRSTDGTQKYNNISGIAVDELGSEYANDITMLGATIEESQLFSEAEDPGQLTRGLYQQTLSETNISEQDTLDDKATEELNARATIPNNIGLQMIPLQNPVFGTFDVGDIFTVQMKYYNFRDFSLPYRLYRFTVNVDDNGVETLNFELGNI